MFPTIAIAPDGFKGCMSSLEAALAIEKGLRMGFPGISTRIIPMADGGEGTVAAMVAAMGGEIRIAKVCGPVGGEVRAAFGLVDDGATAIVEMSSASGMGLLVFGAFDPMGAHTLGTGELIRAALDCGVKKVVIGLGGSASTDGGVGMAKALGVRFLDCHGVDISLGGGGLTALASVDVSMIDPRVADVQFEGVCDVRTPLCGPDGSARVFGPQKGATPVMVERLERGLEQLGECIQHHLGKAIVNLPGAGAAGGLGGGLVAFLGARLCSGAVLVAETIRLQQRLEGADWVITGEGCLDGQTLVGKAPAQVAQVAKSLGLPVIAVCGIAGPGVENCHAVGIDAWFSASFRPLTPPEISELGPSMVTMCAQQIGALLKLKQATSVCV